VAAADAEGVADAAAVDAAARQRLRTQRLLGQVAADSAEAVAGAAAGVDAAARARRIARA
jgi:hypothetical protein